MTRPLVSIITVVYNDIEIENTIRSVIPFLDSNVEYIVIDGGSTDGTRQIIDKYKDHISQYISEPDKGIYDAMNKGVKVACGKYIFHLNSGDELIKLPINLISQVNADIISFQVSINNREQIYNPIFDIRTKFRTSLHHQGTLYKKELVVYDTNYRIFADFDLNQRLYKNKASIKIINNIILSNHLENGISSNAPKRRLEYRRIINKNFGFLYVIIFYLHLIYKLLNGRKNY